MRHGILNGIISIVRLFYIVEWFLHGWVFGEDIHSVPLQFISFSAVPDLPFAERLLTYRAGSNVAAGSESSRIETLNTTTDSCPAESECSFMSNCPTLRRIQPARRCEVSISPSRGLANLRLPGGTCCRRSRQSSSSISSSRPLPILATAINNAAFGSLGADFADPDLPPRTRKSGGHLGNFIVPPNAAGTEQFGGKSPLFLLPPTKDTIISFLPGEAPVNVKQAAAAVPPATMVSTASQTGPPVASISSVNGKASSLGLLNPPNDIATRPSGGSGDMNHVASPAVDNQSVQPRPFVQTNPNQLQGPQQMPPQVAPVQSQQPLFGPPPLQNILFSPENSSPQSPNLPLISQVPPQNPGSSFSSLQNAQHPMQPQLPLQPFSGPPQQQYFGPPNTGQQSSPPQQFGGPLPASGQQNPYQQPPRQIPLQLQPPAPPFSQQPPYFPPQMPNPNLPVSGPNPNSNFGDGPQHGFPQYAEPQQIQFVLPNHSQPVLVMQPNQQPGIPSRASTVPQQQPPPQQPPMEAPAFSAFNAMALPAISASSNTFCGVPDQTFTGRSGRILGGRPSAFGAWPWMAVILSSKRLRCGATILNEQFLITAAHCVYKNAMYGYFQDLSVRIGLFSMDEEDIGPYAPQEIRIQRVMIHPLFNVTQSSYDLALIQVSAPIIFAPHIKPVCLPSSEHLGETGTVLGWGKRKESDDRSNLPMVLQEVNLPILYPWQCILELRTNQIYEDIGPQFVCAGGKANQDACRGDSGGPLLALSNNQYWEMIGIVSKGYGCGKENTPGIYTNIFYLKDWIENTVAQNWNIFRGQFSSRERSDYTYYR